MSKAPPNREIKTIISVIHGKSKQMLEFTNESFRHFEVKGTLERGYHYYRNYKEFLKLKLQNLKNGGIKNHTRVCSFEMFSNYLFQQVWVLNGNDPNKCKR